MARIVQGSVRGDSYRITLEDDTIWRVAFLAVDNTAPGDEYNAYLFAQWLGVDFVPEARFLDIDTIEDSNLPIPPTNADDEAYFERGIMAALPYIVKQYDIAPLPDNQLGLEWQTAIRIFDLVTLNPDRDITQAGLTTGGTLMLNDNATAFTMPEFEWRAAAPKEAYRRSALTPEELAMPHARDIITALAQRDIEDVIDSMDFRYGDMNNEQGKMTYDDPFVPPRQKMIEMEESGIAPKAIRRAAQFWLPVERGKGLPDMQSITEREYLRRWVPAITEVLMLERSKGI